MMQEPGPGNNPQHESILRSVRQWVETFVVGMDLCPFAKREMLRNTVRFTVTASKTEEQLLIALQAELERLDADSSVETTLLVFAELLQNFDDYNAFLTHVDNLLLEMNLQGIYQVASFHPQYQFDGTQPDDAENYTNRSPYPMLHLIREASLEQAIAGYPEVDQIPTRNIEQMNRLGRDKLQALLTCCLSSGAS